MSQLDGSLSFGREHRYEPSIICSDRITEKQLLAMKQLRQAHAGLFANFMTLFGRSIS